MAPVTQALPLACLLLLGSAPGADAQAGQGFQLQQPQMISVMAGETLTLSCTVTAGGPIGPMKWLKGWGSGNETVYDQKDPSSSRGTRIVSDSSTDFTILIMDVRPEDAGTYYCVKFRKTPTGDELYRRGEGTVVVVQARPSNPTVSGPSDRVEPGKTASFTCNSWGFFPSDIRVKWFKDKTLIQSQLPNVTPEPSNFTYSLSSTVTVTLQKDDIRSELTCQVLHTTLTAPLTRSYRLSQVLRVPPKVVMAEPPGPVGLNERVSFTCYVQGFYPGSVTVTWLENGKEMNTGSTPQPTETPEGLFELRSTVAVQAMPEKNGSVFTCRVLHEGQDPLSRNATLWVAASGQKESSSPYTNGANAQVVHVFELHQPQKEVSVRVGETLFLICTVTEGGPIGPVNWLKGLGSGNETVYDQKYLSSSRGTRAVGVSNTDFTILIRDVRPEDAGTYYCVKFCKTPTGDDELYRRGEGTVVVVLAVQGFHLLSSPGLWLCMLLEKAILGLVLFFLFKRWQA
ncbi:signal-regulatory protein beta-1-like [Aythya fuligula]|uniref:Signal-regulatory protein beta-1-like n=1 Tax=Aythya fuligula TaxID=219594 RepID=A0A6J3DX00_AYTFU|nr:signal-regulatory protein beta-1-like [Aythya fuligula]